MTYFTMNELTASVTAKNLHIDNTPSKEIEEHLTELVDKILDPLRKAWGKPIVVSSGYRCKLLNDAVGGSKTSAHMYGYAADIHPLNYENKKFLSFTKDFLRRNKIAYDQIINEYPDRNGNPSWIHIGIKNKDGQQRKRELTLG